MRGSARPLTRLSRCTRKPTSPRAAGRGEESMPHAHTSPIHFSNSQRSAARVVWRAPGSPVFPFPLPPLERERGRRADWRDHFLCARLLAKAWRLSARHRGFSVPGAVLPGCDGTRAGSPIRAASAALRRRRVQPLKAAGHNAGGRLARASRGWGYESRPRAPHRRCRVYPISAPLRRLHHRDVSRRRPQSSRTRAG